MNIYYLLKNNLSCIDLILIEGKMKEINGLLINNKNIIILLFNNQNVGNVFIKYLLEQYKYIKLLYYYNNDVLFINNNYKYNNIIEILKLIIIFYIKKYYYLKLYIKFKNFIYNFK